MKPDPKEDHQTSFVAPAISLKRASWAMAMTLSLPFGPGACKGGSGQGLASQCRTRSDCQPGALCDRGRCVVLCTFDADCPTGQTCQARACIPEREARQCDQDPDCVSPGDCQVGEGARCVRGECLYASLDCSKVPEPKCVDDMTLRTFSSAGCHENACQFNEHESQCTLDDGKCGETCREGCRNAPCDDATQLQGGCSQGICLIDAEGLPECHYEPANKEGETCPDGDEQPCTAGVCDAAGQCLPTRIPTGERCEQDAGVCDDTGACVQCLLDSDCETAEKPYCRQEVAQCVACKQNVHCDNGLFCDGAETCDTQNGFVCQSGEPCVGACNEQAVTCVWCRPGEACHGDEIECTDHVCNDNGVCVLENDDRCLDPGEPCEIGAECNTNRCDNRICCQEGVTCCTESSQCADGFTCDLEHKACNTSCTADGNECKTSHYCRDQICRVKSCGVEIAPLTGPQDGQVTIPFMVTQDGGLPVNVQGWYSLDRGPFHESFEPMAVDCDGDSLPDQGQSLSTSPTGETHCLVWDSEANSSADIPAKVKLACTVAGGEQYSGESNEFQLHNDREPDPGELIISEILLQASHNPPGRYVELHNMTNHTLALENVQIKRWASNQTLDEDPRNTLTITASNFDLEPRGYVVVAPYFASTDEENCVSPQLRYFHLEFPINSDSVYRLTLYGAVLSELSILDPVGVWPFDENTAVGVDLDMAASQGKEWTSSDVWCAQKGTIECPGQFEPFTLYATPGANNSPCGE